MWMLLSLALCIATFGAALPIAAEGSRTLLPREPVSEFRANIEWRNSSYGGIVKRRTLFEVYARVGEYIRLGSSAIDVPGEPDRGDIRVYNPGLVTGEIGQREIPVEPSYSCVQQRQATGNVAQGRIGSREQELNGPNTSTNAVPAGYTPCFYQAPVNGIYNVAFWGPAGDDRDSETAPAGQIDPPAAEFGPRQNTSVTAWDITVRDSLESTEDRNGRVFAYFYAMFSGGNGRNLKASPYIVTRDGFIYRLDLGGDANGFLIYANRFGFLDTDGNPLYRNVMAVPTMTFDEQNQLVQLQGGVSLAPPEFPIFLNPPDPATIQALGYPTEPVAPEISDLAFRGALGDGSTTPGQGGTFSLISSAAGVVELVISRDGQNFDPTKPENRFFVLWWPKRGRWKSRGMGWIMMITHSQPARTTLCARHYGRASYISRLSMWKITLTALRV
jgi:hypothetical protein